MRDLSFYEVTAQVIPVLLLTLAVDSRFSARKSTRSPGKDMVISVAVVVATLTLVAAELGAVAVLAGASETGARKVVICVALIAGFTCVALQFIDGHITRMARTTVQQKWERRALLIGILCFIVAVLVSAFI